MDLYHSKQVLNRKRLSSTEERFFGVPPLTPSLDNSNPVELTEDEVLFSNYDSTQPSSSSSPPIPTPIHHNNNHNHNQHHKSSPHSFGILAALPENEVSPNSENGSQFFHKAPVSVSLSASVSSSSSSSSSRRFLSIPRIPSDRNLSSTQSFRFHHQSAPVNIPMMSPAMVRAAKKFEEEEAKKIEELEDEEIVIPPHEFVTKKSVMRSAISPMLSYSLMEGVGRTLKGRDMRQVRNAVLRQTGFFD